MAKLVTKSVNFLAVPTGIAAKITDFSLNELAVRFLDPITGRVTWENISIPVDGYIWIGYIFGFYDEAKDAFEPMYWHSTASVWGTHARKYISSGSNWVDIDTFANRVSVETVVDALVFVTGDGQFLDTKTSSGGEWRVTGLSWSNYQALAKHAVRYYKDILTVRPYG